MKKGFTLIELLAVIAVLAIVLLIAIPFVVGIVSEVKTNTYVKEESMLALAAKNYIAANQSMIPNNIGDTIEVKLSTLQSGNYIGSIKDPSNNATSCGGYVLVSRTNNGIEYNPHLNCDYINDGYIADGLVINQKLDNSLLDATPNKYNGTLYGPIAANNRFNNSNKALSFDGVDDYGDVGNIGVLTKYTASVWINPSLLLGTGETLTYGFTIMATSSNYGLWLLYNNKEIKLYAYSSSTATFGTTVNANVDINTWSQITVTAEINGNASIYINGELNTTFAASSAAWAGNLTIGDLRPNRLIGFNGLIDDVKIYNRLLSSYEIKRNYMVEKIRNY